MTLVVAHRGDPLLLRENTLPSVESAIRAGADWVEVDLKLSRDGVPVLLHDDTLTRLWGRDQRVDSLSWSDLDRLTAAGSDGEWRIPTLRQALRLSGDAGVPLMIDVPRPAEADAALALVLALDCLALTVFTGPPAALAGVRAAAPRACLAMSWESLLPPRPELLRRVRPDFFNLHHRLLTAGRIARLQRSGLKVSAWTVDGPKRMSALAATGIDAIISNDLRSLRKAVARHSPG